MTFQCEKLVLGMGRFMVKQIQELPSCMYMCSNQRFFLPHSLMEFSIRSTHSLPVHLTHPLETFPRYLLKFKGDMEVSRLELIVLLFSTIGIHREKIQLRGDTDSFNRCG